MKNRKIFLDGYIELSRELFKSGKTYESFVVIDTKRNFLGLGAGSLQLAKVNTPVGEHVNARIGIHNSNEKFIIVFDDDGVFKTKRNCRGMVRFNSVGIVRKLIECGFQGDKHYKVNSPEEGVLVVTKEEA
jgi:hypothetical protein